LPGRKTLSIKIPSRIAPNILLFPVVRRRF